MDKARTYLKTCIVCGNQFEGKSPKSKRVQKNA